MYTCTKLVSSIDLSGSLDFGCIVTYFHVSNVRQDIIFHFIELMSAVLLKHAVHTVVKSVILHENKQIISYRSLSCKSYDNHSLDFSNADMCSETRHNFAGHIWIPIHTELRLANRELLKPAQT